MTNYNILKVLKNFFYPQLPYKLCKECDDKESDHEELRNSVYKCNIPFCDCKGFKK